MIPSGDKIFIKISNETRDKTEKVSVTKTDGSVVDLQLNLPGYKNIHQYEYAVRHGVVTAVSETVKHILPGDYVIFMPHLDYDQKHFLSEDATGKMIWANATTTFHTEDRVVYGYGGGVERRQLTWADGDINELSFIVAIIRNEEMIPNVPYIFCEPEEEAKPFTLDDILKGETESLKLSEAGLWLPPATEKKSKELLIRTILMSSDPSLKSGMTVIVKEDSEFIYNVMGQKLCVIYSMDVLAQIES